MGNRDTSAARDYHEATKHSYWSVRGGQGLDWPNQPIPFKIYKDLESVRLPSDGPPVLGSVRDAMGAGPPDPSSPFIPGSGLVARLLYLSAGITKKKLYPGGEIYFRAAACTGALYHIDLYLVCGDMPGLEAGVYHFGPHDFGLGRLRVGDYRGVLAKASGMDASVVDAPVTVVLADTHWRNSWKYGPRAYRHTYWDSGTLLSQILAGASGAGAPAKVVTSFVDEDVHGLLGLEKDKESVVALVALGRGGGGAREENPPVNPVSFATEPLSPKMIEYDEIYKMHRASSLSSMAEVEEVREGRIASSPEAASGELIALPRGEGVGMRGFEETVIRRGSTRRFAREPISLEELSVALKLSTRQIESDFKSADGRLLNELFLIVNAVEGLASGAYRYDRATHVLEMLKEGDFRREAQYLGLEQAIPGDASVNVYMLTDLGKALEAFGNRGYRMAQLESGIIGGRLYLAAYGMGFGASGLTFYDDEVIEFFGPRAEGLDPMFLVALGRSVKFKKEGSR